MLKFTRELARWGVGGGRGPLLPLNFTYKFLPRDDTQSAVMRLHVVCLSVCLSVCPSLRNV